VARALSREQARVLHAIARGPSPAGDRAGQRGVDLTTIRSRAGISLEASREEIRFLSRRDEGYVVQVPGTVRKPRWALSKWARDRIPTDPEWADVLVSAYQARNHRSGKVNINDVTRALAADYLEERVREVLAGMAGTRYYLSRDRLQGSDYYILHASRFQYEELYIQLWRQ
jgi:hypothetical protein